MHQLATMIRRDVLPALLLPAYGREVSCNQRRCAMGAEDKFANKAEELKGKAKERIGDVTGDEQMEDEGQRDETKANLKQAGEKIKDAFDK